MKKIWIVAVIGLMLIAGLSACGTVNSSGYNMTPQINVTGNGQVYIVPDVAYVNIGVHSEAPEVAAALESNNQQAQAIRDTLIDQGVEEKDIQTSAFNVYPMQEYSPTGEVTGTKYVVDNTVMVTVRNLGNLGMLLDSAVTSGANTINSITFDATDKDAAYAEARKLAVEKAKQQAQDLADEAGVELGKIISLNAYNSGPQPVYDVKSYSGVGGAAETVPVAAGQIVISVDASISYAIK